MSELAIDARGLGKRYRLGQRIPYKTLRESLSVATGNVLARLGHAAERGDPAGGQHIWALRDVSFTLHRGEVLGVIGRNGAGKSTLLKLLSRITEPSEGSARISGRVGSLLEVGTGFHPELTGRENVFLNGAVLGMSRREIVRKLDEITDFADIHDFMETPVKRYSSGMYMRLAFAVAAHLEPDVLIVDEVLAVGDAAFQRKCLGKMSDVAQGGRTVLFVSHNMAAIESLCDRALWIDEGRVVGHGEPSDVISRYLRTAFSPSLERSWAGDSREGSGGRVRLHRALVRPEGGTSGDPMTVETPLVLEFEWSNLRPDRMLNLSLHVYNEQGVMVFNAVPVEERNWQGRPFPAGVFRDRCHVPGNLLNDGMHRVELLIVENDTNVILRVDDALIFDVTDNLAGRGAWYGKWSGAVRPRLAWETEHLGEAPPTGEHG